MILARKIIGAKLFQINNVHKVNNNKGSGQCGVVWVSLNEIVGKYYEIYIK